MSGLGNSSEKCSKLVLTPSLLMRMFEWCHEDAANDVAMHKAFEKIIAFNDGVNPLNMDVYEAIVDGANDGQEKEAEEDSEECTDTYCYDNPEYCCHDYNNYNDYYTDTYCQAPEADKYCCHTYDTSYEYPVDCSYPDPNECCHKAAPIDYTSVDTYYEPFGMGNYDGKPTTITIDCVKDEVPCEDCPQEEVITPEIEQQMMQAFRNAQG